MYQSKLYLVHRNVFDNNNDNNNDNDNDNNNNNNNNNVLYQDHITISPNT